MNPLRCSVYLVRVDKSPLLGVFMLKMLRSAAWSVDTYRYLLQDHDFNPKWIVKIHLLGVIHPIDTFGEGSNQWHGQASVSNLP